MPILFQLLKASTAVKALLGQGTALDPLRVYPWSEAPAHTQPPYATYGVYNGNPANVMDKTPDIDNMGTQVDIWAKTASSCEECFTAIRDALEQGAHMTNFALPNLDPATKLYHARQEFDFWTPRA